MSTKNEAKAGPEAAKAAKPEAAPESAASHELPAMGAEDLAALKARIAELEANAHENAALKARIQELEAKPVAAAPVKREARAPARKYDEAEQKLAKSLRVDLGDIFAVNVKSGIIVTVDGRKIGGAA